MPRGRLETVIRWSPPAAGLLCFLLCLGCYKVQWVHNCEEDADCEVGHCYSGYCFSEANAEKYGFTEDDIIWEAGDDGEDAQTDDENRSDALNGVDVLFVVDNTFTMVEEHEALLNAAPGFVEGLAQKLLDGFDNQFDGVSVRFAVTTTDLGVSVGGQPYDVSEPFNLAPGCGEQEYGDGGQMRTTYEEPYAGMHSCVSSDRALRGDLYFEMSEAGDEEMLMHVLKCMMPVGTEGCAFEQHFSAMVMAVSREDQHRFFRGDALTVIIMVTDEDDCSVKEAEWIAVAEESANPALVCGENPSLLYNVSELKEQLEAARTAATGVERTNTILFAAIAGVPVGSDCEGGGDEIDNCLNVALPGGGTMADPRMVNGEGTGRTSNYALACTRYSEDGDAITQAYPAIRIVKMAQKFDEMGYLYSICHTDFSAAMKDIAKKIEKRLEATVSVE